MNFTGFNNSVHNRDIDQVTCGKAGAEEHQRTVTEEIPEDHVKIRPCLGRARKHR